VNGTIANFTLEPNEPTCLVYQVRVASRVYRWNGSQHWKIGVSIRHRWRRHHAVTDDAIAGRYTGNFIDVLSTVAVNFDVIR
jgi:hypothetical protein